MIRRPPRSTLFPYTTLFRSRHFEHRIVVGAGCADVTSGPGLLAQVPGFTSIAPAQEDVYHLRQHSRRSPRVEVEIDRPAGLQVRVKAALRQPKAGFVILTVPRQSGQAQFINAEERRVGKECRSRWSPYH